MSLIWLIGYVMNDIRIKFLLRFLVIGLVALLPLCVFAQDNQSNKSGLKAITSADDATTRAMLYTGFDKQKTLFISIGPSQGSSPLGPHTATIYEIDTLTGTLVENWKLPTGQHVTAMRFYERQQILLLSIGTYKQFEQIYIIPLTEPSEFTHSNLSQYGRITNLGIVVEPTGEIYLQLVALQDDNTVRQLIVGIKDGKKLTSASSSIGAERRITGTASPYYGPSGDAISFRSLSGGKFVPFMEDFDFAGSLVPDNLVQRKESNGWNMVANEPSFRALLSVAERSGYTDRELLVHNRQEDVWRSILLPGSETSLRLIGKWLTGVVADKNPDTDYVRHVGRPPVLSENVVLINPNDGSKFVVHLGKRSEILWIGDNTVYFRVGTKLYSGSLVNGNITSRKLLFEAPFVHTIHWAFNSEKGDSN